MRASKLPRKMRKSLTAESWAAKKILPINLKTNVKQKKVKTTIITEFKFIWESTFKIWFQLINPCKRKKPNNTIEIIANNKKKVVLTYILPFWISPIARASANLFRNPLAKPISK